MINLMNKPVILNFNSWIAGFTEYILHGFVINTFFKFNFSDNQPYFSNLCRLDDSFSPNENENES